MADSSFSPTPADLDAMTRAVVGEAQSEPDDGQAGVAHVILNRLAAGNYGDSPTEIVMAGSNTPRPQFEPTGNRSSAFYTTSPQTPAYKHAAAIVQGVLSGDIPDPTNGATNFYAPVAQQAMGRAAPSWASGQKPTAVIGGHIFFAPNGPANGSSLLAPKPNNDGPDGNLGGTGLPALAYADGPPAAAPPAAPSQGQPMPQASDANAAFAKEWGIDPSVMPKSAPAAPAAAPGVSFAPAASAPVAAPSSADANAAFAKEWGIDPSVMPGAAAPAPVAQAAPAVSSTPIGVNDAVRAVGTGVPIIGGLLNKADAALNATVAPVANSLFAPPDQLQGATWGDRYNNALMQQQRMDASFASQHPVANTALNVAGSVAGTAPAMMAAPGAFGISGAPVLGRMIMGGGTNALIGGADAAARGNSIAGGAELGFLTGAAGPIAGKAIGSTVGALANRLMTPNADGMGGAATRYLVNALRADTPDAVQANLMRLGPEASLADAGPSMLGVAQGAALQPGAGKTALTNMLDTRYGGATGRLGTDLDHLLGPAEDPQQVTNSILAQRGATDAANYGAVHGQNVPVDTSDVVNLIDSHLGTPTNPIATGAQATALRNLRGSLVARDAVPATDTTAAQPPAYFTGSQYLHNIRQEIDGLMDGSAPGLGVQQGSISRANGSLGAVRGALDDALKSQVPGMAQADAASAALAARADAVRQGTNMLMSGKTGITPTSFADNMANMTPGEQIALNKGARGEIDRLVGTQANDPAALRRALQGEGGWNTNKLATAFGAEPTQGLVDAVDREGTFANTRNDVLKGPQTAARLVAEKGMADADTPNVNMLGTTATGAALQAGRNFIVNPLLRAVSGANRGPMREELGQAMSLQGDPRDMLINQLMGALGRSNGAGALASVMDRGVTAGTNLLMTQGGKRMYPGAFAVQDGLPAGSP